MLLLCVIEKQIEHIMEEVHAESCGLHMNGRVHVEKILTLGYFWFTMEANCAKFIRRYHKARSMGTLIMYHLVSCTVRLHLGLLL